MKIEQLGHFEHKEGYQSLFILENFDSSWEKTKKGTFLHTIWEVRFRFREELKFDTEKIDSITIVLNKDTISKLTKNVTSLLNELLKEKVIKLSRDKGFFQPSYFIVNNTKVYCQDCEYWLADKNHNRKKEDKEESEPFYEYEINKHLEIKHHKNYRGYDGKGELRDPITPEVIKKYIRYQKPEFETHDHQFEVTNIELDRQYLDVKVKCKNCGTEETLRSNSIRSCIQEKDKEKEVLVK